MHRRASELKAVEASSAAPIRIRLPMATDERYDSNSLESLVHGCANSSTVHLELFDGQ